MSFEEWWDEETNENGIEYLKLGKYALRNIALTAYDKGCEHTKKLYDKAYEDATKKISKLLKE